jgi:hypothetical protein
MFLYTAGFRADSLDMKQQHLISVQTWLILGGDRKE